ncbi:hypothetical protein DL96DRAFT_1715206 [Flagelloscypha sp. PMI_526]|nr:hypothetical protein DL96DRAFT_1715206 [Flagelloscypha sp. PMI_526]
MGAFNLAVGSYLLGLSFDLYLYGFVFNQYLTYKNTKFDDRIWLRAIVATLFVVDTSQVAVELYTVWVENYTNPSALNHLFWMLGVFGVGTALSASIVQTFLINRLYQLTRQFWLYIVLIFVTIAAFLCGAIAGFWVGIFVDATKPIPVIPLEIAWLATVAGVDIVITVTLSRALWRSKTGFLATDTNINRCIRASIQSGLFSSVFALAGLAAFAFWGNTHVNMIFGWPSGRIYSNSLLYTLVSRKEHAEIANRTIEIQRTELFSPPVPPQISSVHFPREILTDTNVADNTMKPSLDRHITFSPPTGSEGSQLTSSC